MGRKGETTTLTVLSLNCMLLPLIQSVTTRAAQAALWLCQCMPDVEVLVLQEIFSPLGSMTLHRGLIAKWPFLMRPLGNKRGINGGVLIASKYPLSHVAAFEYSQGTGSDAWAAKGAVAATIHPPRGMPVVVVGTHLQAGWDSTCRAVRHMQWQELAWFVHTWVGGRTGGATPVIVAGDFNDDMATCTEPETHRLCNIPPPATAGLTFDMDHNEIARRRAEPDDISATLDGILVAQPSDSKCICFASCTVVRPRAVDGEPFTDHEALLAAFRWQQPRAAMVNRPLPPPPSAP